MGQQSQRYGSEEGSGVGADGKKRDSKLLDRQKERKQAVQARWSRRVSCGLNGKYNGKPARQQLEPTEAESRQAPYHIGPQNGLLLAEVAHRIGFRRCLDAREPSMGLWFGHKPEIGVRLLVLVLILAAVALSVVGRCPELAVVTPLVRLAVPGDARWSVARGYASPATCSRSASLGLVLGTAILVAWSASGRRTAALSASVAVRTATAVVTTVLALLAGFRTIAGVMTCFSAVETLGRVLVTVLRTF
jgi:hypothetical protein